MSLIRSLTRFDVFYKLKLAVSSLVMALLFGILFVFNGCVKMEATRKADWESHFTDLYFVNHKQGWVVGEKGLIIHTADGGKTWKQQEVDTTSPGFRLPDASLDFKAVYFTNADYGWAVGDEGLVAATDDGGKHWTLQRSGTSAMLLDVFFANSKEGWIVGEGADVLYTENGGKEWKRYEYVSDFMLNGVWFVNDSTGWVVGTHDRILHTKTGGESWREQSNRFAGERDRMINDNKQVFFVSDNEGWIVGSDGSIFHTTTGGVNWERQDSRIPLINGHVRDTVNSIHFTDENYGIAVADVGFITRTEDGGDNWQLMESGTENNLTGIQFTTPNEAWAVGWYGTILHTTDAGATWGMTSGITANDLQNVQFTDANRAIAVGRRGTMAMSNDGGQTWNEIETDIWDGIWNIYFATDKHGWAVGERGLIVHTNDGGTTWERQRGPSAFTLRSVHFISPEVGWIVGDVGTILHTIDGGKAWLPQTPVGDFLSLMLKGVFFLDDKRGWAIGWPGVCLATEDGGLTWTQQTTGTFNELYAAYFTDENTGWIVGQFGEILYTKNGGKRWNFQRSGTQENLNKLYFADTQHGLIVGDDGVMLTTVNGGAKWETQESGTDNDLYGLALSPNGVVAVGKGGIAMRYSIEEAELPAKLPPVAEEPEIVAAEEEAVVEPVAYHWDIIRQATWRTNFADTHFVDAQNGWAVGSSGVIAHTTDGGKTWLPQHSGVSENLRQVEFSDKKHGRILGTGILLQTENGGETWQPILQATKQNLPRVSTMHFLNSEEGWLGAAIGQTLHTTDGGKTWKIQKTGTTTANITDLHFINSQKGWAVTPQRRDGGFILHTVDGGDYWKIQAKTNQPGIAVHFADENRGWVVLGNGNSLLTEDGGETWRLQTTAQSTRGLQRITFRSHTNAWGLGGDGAYTTEDQGVNWKAVPVAMGDDMFAMWETDSAIPEESEPELKESEEEGEEVAEGPTLQYDETPEEIQSRLRAQRQRPGRFAPEGELPPNAERTTPAPAPRQQQPPPPPAPEGRRRRGARRIASVYFLDAENAWAVGSGGSIYHTADGAETWERQLGEQQPTDFRKILFYDDKNGWIAGDRGVLLETQDGGQTWETLRSRTRQRLIGVHFASLEPKWGWAMQRDGTVLYTTDGVTWTAGDTPEEPPFMEGDPPGTFSLNDVDFGKFSEGWAVGNSGSIIHNKDGGPTWTPQRTTANDTLMDVDMKFAPLGWAVGREGVTQRTINSGAYWRMHETKTNYDLYAVSFSAKRTGWAAGEGGIVLKTTDGGFTWQPKLTGEFTGITKNLHGIIALSDQEIYAVGEEGTIVHSTDGGETWEQEHTDIDNNLYVITRSKDGKTLWVVGQWGVVLRRKLETPAQMSMR